MTIPKTAPTAPIQQLEASLMRTPQAMSDVAARLPVY